MNIEYLKNSGQIILSILSGSHLYGLNINGSDVDTRGIFDLPLKDFILPNCAKQINDETNDSIYYEVVKFLELAQKANPNILELMFAPDDKILFKDPRADIILNHKEKFLTKNTKNSLCGYAIAQIRKARGQNKMIVQPILERKSVLDFCYILVPHGTVPLKDWLAVQRGNGFNQLNYGASKVPNARDMYYIYLDTTDKKYGFRGLMKDDNSSNELRLESIPKEILLQGHEMSFNRDGYTSHCNDYKKQKDWVKNRNKIRYNTNAKHGKGYDSKNMMHCFRLLNMGLELAKTGELNVVRPDKAFLLDIRLGNPDFDYLIAKAENLLQEVDEAFDKCNLPNSVSGKLINEMISEFKLPKH